MQIQSKTDLLDSNPTYFLEECVDILPPVITNITHLSEIAETVPYSLMFAIIIPLIKFHLLRYHIGLAWNSTIQIAIGNMRRDLLYFKN